MLEPLVPDARQHCVELLLADEEGVVLWRDRAVLLHEVERDAVVEVDDHEVHERPRLRPAENVGEEGRRPHLVAAPDDYVVELDGHRPLGRVLYGRAEQIVLVGVLDRDLNNVPLGEVRGVAKVHLAVDLGRVGF